MANKPVSRLIKPNTWLLPHWAISNWLPTSRKSYTAVRVLAAPEVRLTGSGSDVEKYAVKVNMFAKTIGFTVAHNIEGVEMCRMRPMRLCVGVLMLMDAKTSGFTVVYNI